MTTKNSKTSKTASSKASSKGESKRKSNYDPEKMKAYRERRAARKAEILRLETKKAHALRKIAEHAVNDNLNGDELVELIRPLREEIAQLDAELVTAKAKMARKANAWQPREGHIGLYRTWSAANDQFVSASHEQSLNNGALGYEVKLIGLEGKCIHHVQGFVNADNSKEAVSEARKVATAIASALRKVAKAEAKADESK